MRRTVVRRTVVRWTVVRWTVVKRAVVKRAVDLQILLFNKSCCKKGLVKENYCKIRNVWFVGRQVIARRCLVY